MLGRVEPRDLPALYAASDLLVVPSVRTRTFLEPWGLVVNEAMLQGTAVVASDAVGAVAGGLVLDGETGITFPADDAHALATRIRRLAAAPDLRRSVGRAGREAARALTATAWAEGVAQALARAGVSRSAAVEAADGAAGRPMRVAAAPPGAAVTALAGRRSGP
jgi:glycosyltransferase involved in cell wall biosynthesis